MKMKRVFSKLTAACLTAAMLTSLTACGEAPVDIPYDSGSASSEESSYTDATYTVGICNYVDDASLNQIVASLEGRLYQLGKDNNVVFEIADDNCNANATQLNQIISNFVADDVDLMVAIATPVAVAMQSATEDNEIPVVFSAVTDPVGVDLIDSMEKPGGNLTGTSDYLDTTAVMNLIFAANPQAKKIGLLYDQGQDASTAAIASAKKYLNAKGADYIERTGTTNDEVAMAADALIAAGVDAVFTPTDNTIMTAELGIYEKFIHAGIPHYTGADSFALNGAFLGYGVDYANLGAETAEMIADILINEKDPAEVPVKTFDNGTATINTETCKALGLDFADICTAFQPLCSQIKEITTANEFSDLDG